MSEFLDLPVRQFLAATAARQPTPGGGSVAALAGALSASLAAMALEYTLGKKAYAASEPENRKTLASFVTASVMFQELLTEDIAAYQALSALLKLPPDQRSQNPDFLPALVAAIRVPQTAAALALNVLQSCSDAFDRTNKFLLSDLAVAAAYAHATVHASDLMVRVNLPLLPNQAEAAALRASMAELLAKADSLYKDLHEKALAEI